MLKGRQTTWLVFDHFRLSDIVGAMLNWDEILKLELKIPGDNIRQFLNDWDATFTNVNTSPDPDILESLFKRQLEKSNQLKGTLALYDQEITQRQATKSYKKLRYIVDNYLEETLLKKNQASLASNNRGPKVNAALDTKAEKANVRSGYCTKWCKTGDCAAGSKCPWAASHTHENRSWWSKAGEEKGQVNASAKSKGKGKGKKGKNGKARSPSPKDKDKPERGRSREKKGRNGRTPTPPKGRPSTPTPKKRGTSPSGNKDKPACFRWLKGTCTDKNCGYWHSPACRDFKAGSCVKGKNCEFVHHTDKIKAAIAKTKASMRPCRFFTLVFDEDYLPELIDDSSADEKLCATKVVADCTPKGKAGPSAPYPRCVHCRKPIGQGPECRTSVC